VKSKFYYLVFMLFSRSVFSADDDAVQYRLDLDNASYKFVECSVYYNIASIGVAGRGEKELANKLDEASSLALKIAVDISAINQDRAMAEKVTQSRMELTAKEMTKEINSDLSNSSILINKYSEKCTKYMKDPMSVMSTE